MPPADPYELRTRLVFGPGTWFEQCRAAVGDPAATAGLLDRLAPAGDAARAFATRTTWPGESRLAGPADRPPGPAESAALALAKVTTALTTGTDLEDRLRAAAAHWRRANVLPALSLTGADLDAGLADPPAAAVTRRLAVLTDEATPPETAALGLLALLVRALAGEWPRRRREVQLPVLFDRRSTGGHAILRLTVLEAGPPGLYPDPRAMTFLVADQRFGQALAVAWETAGAALAGRCVVWRLTTDDLPGDEVAGGSLGAAFGVALTDLARRTPQPLRARRLDRRCAVTAGLEPDRRLSAVTGLTNKLEEAVRQRLRVILAPVADREALPEPLLRDARVEFAADLATAVRRSRSRLNPAFAAIVVVLLLAAAGVSSGLVAAARQSRAAHIRTVAAGLLPAADRLRNADPAGALLLEALAVRLDGPGARPALLRSVLTNRYAGALTGPDNQSQCGGAQGWSPDGTHVVTVQHDQAARHNAVLLWDTRQRVIDRTIEIDGQVDSCAFAPDGRTLALSVDQHLVLVTLDRPSPATPVSDVTVESVQYAPNGLLVTTARSQPVRLWSATDPPRVRAQLPVSGLAQLAFSRDARTLALGDRERVALADVSRPDAPRVIGSIPARPSVLAMSSRYLLAIGLSSGDTELWDLRDRRRPVRAGRLSAPAGLSLPVASAGFTPDGSRLVVAGGGGVSQIWRVGGAGPLLIGRLALTGSQVTSAGLSPDGETALVEDTGHPPALWLLSDLETRPALGTLPLGPARVTGLHILPPGDRLVVTAAGGAATVWDLTDRARPRLLHSAGRATAVDFTAPPLLTELATTAFAADGRRFAAADGKGGIGVWTVEPDGRIRATGSIPRIGEEGIAPLALSPDGSLLVARSSGYPVGLWDVRAGPRQVGRLPATAEPTATAFTPDGRTLVTVLPSAVTWWNAADPANPVARATRGLPAADRSDGPIVFTADGRRTYVTLGTSPGGVWDTSDPADPELLATVRPVSGSDADEGVRLGPALVLTAAGALDVWDVADPATAGQAAQLAGDFYFGHLAATPAGLLAATQLADGTASVYTQEAVVRLRDLRPILAVLDDPVAAACRIAGHDLSAQLWREHAPGVAVRPLCR